MTAPKGASSSLPGISRPSGASARSTATTAISSRCARTCQTCYGDGSFSGSASVSQVWSMPRWRGRARRSGTIIAATPPRASWTSSPRGKRDTPGRSFIVIATCLSTTSQPRSLAPLFGPLGHSRPRRSVLWTVWSRPLETRRTNSFASCGRCRLSRAMERGSIGPARRHRLRGSLRSKRPNTGRQPFFSEPLRQARRRRWTR